MIASDLMTENPTTIRATDTVSQALETLQSLDIRHLPVVDDEDNLVGMLSDRDLGPLMRSFTEGEEADRMVLTLSRRRVSDYMSSDVVCIDEDADLSEVIDTMLEQRVGALPVVDGEGTVQGIISYVDILRAVGAELERPAPRPGRRRRAAQRPR
ncbi:MAG TPA: CBS domain-containing protein [Polyangiaceae bacterium]|nr:CBS domain-containing protein [Polyangiaceae bacterium]